jgi:cytidyltransferase-like protein
MALPYSEATSGEKAVNDMQKILRGFGCQKFGPMKKIIPLDSLSGIGGTLCHGCFDFLHIGHLRYFMQASKLWKGPLIVTVTSDQFVNKGPRRPFFTHDERAEMIVALTCVRFVAINYAPYATTAIDIIRPRFYCKGVEYQHDVDEGLALERAAVERHGGKLVFIDSGEKFSSTAILKELGHA